jgi:hypothetical protein
MKRAAVKADSDEALQGFAETKLARTTPDA